MTKLALSPARELTRGQLLDMLLESLVADLKDQLAAPQAAASPPKPEPLFWSVRETAEHIGSGFGMNRVRELVRNKTFAATRKDPGNPDSEIMIDPDSVRAWKHGLIFGEAE